MITCVMRYTSGSNTVNGLFACRADELTVVPRQDSLPLFTDVADFGNEDKDWLQQQAPSSQELLHQTLHQHKSGRWTCSPGCK